MSYPDLDSPDLIEDMAPPPPVLYHYTTPKGFFEIVESGPRLHATHHRFLNDVGEIKYGFDVALGVLDQLSELDPEVTRLTKETIDAHLDSDSFLACLSEKPNVLSQWRAYANNGTGYCIGIGVEGRLEGDHDDDDNFRSCHLFKCLYDRGKLDELLKERFRRKIVLRSGKTFNGWEEFLADELAAVAWRYAHLAKHEHFEEEVEWRLVVRAPSREVRYRVGGKGLTPYLPTGNLTIKEVWIGPAVGPTPKVAKRIVTGFLEAHGIVDAKVDCWESPFRW